MALDYGKCKWVNGEKWVINEKSITPLSFGFSGHLAG